MWQVGVLWVVRACQGVLKYDDVACQRVSVSCWGMSGVV